MYWKTCRACKAHRPLFEFYRHGSMRDGHLNRCKECVKERIRKHRVANIEYIQAYDRKRGLTEKRKREVRLRAFKYKSRWNKKWRKKNPAAYAAHIIVSNAVRDGRLNREPCEICGKLAQAHHDDYANALNVHWLCLTHHAQHHREMREKERAA